ncbi:GIY-YIG nuclease family protein [bacterium]|nr:GIY-YIG nuclease family protein [bacterium]
MSRVRAPSLAQIMSYFTYILQSGLDQSFYIGYTANIKKRLEEHNNGESRYTKRKIPWKLVHLELP